jgi:hypothetical protein
MIMGPAQGALPARPAGAERGFGAPAIDGATGSGGTNVPRIDQ